MCTSDCICFEYCFKISYVTPSAPATHNPGWLLSLSASVSFNICRNSLWPCGPGNKWDYFPILVYFVSENILYWYLKATVCDSTVPQQDHWCEHCNHNTMNASDYNMTVPTMWNRPTVKFPLHPKTMWTTSLKITWNVWHTHHSAKN